MSINKQVVITEEGLQKLKNELEHLKSVKRKEIAEKIKVALSFGDLSENSEYDEAKNEQGITETRILELEDILKNVKIVDERELGTEIISVGSKVKIRDLANDEIIDYKIVGSSEASPFEGKISDESPVGASLIGKKVSAKVKINVPDGIVEYEILEIYK